MLISLTGGAGIGALLTEQTGVDVVAHVGSSEAGARIASAANLTGAHVIRENGGNDPLVVDDDVDPVWAAEQAAIGAFSNSGQICTAVERIYVHRAIADRSVRHWKARRGAATWKATWHRWWISACAKRSTGRWPRPWNPGRGRSRVGSIPDGPGAFYPATVLLDCTTDMDIMAEETFGPVAPVQVVDSFDEGLRLAAGGRYGLAATVLTGRHRPRPAGHRRAAGGHSKNQRGVRRGAGRGCQPRGESGHGFGYGSGTAG